MTAAARTRSVSLIVMLALSLVLTGLASTLGASVPDPGSATVIQVDSSGGYVPLEVMQGNVPEVTMTADGRVFVQKANGRYDRMARFRVSEISDERLDDLLARADELGLVDHRDKKDYGAPGVTDQQSTTVTITIDGKATFTTVYALGFDSKDLTDEQQANREELSRFISDVASARTRSPYVPSAIAVLATPVDDAEGAILDWPLADLATAGDQSDLAARCVIVSGTDLDLVLPLAQKSRWSTRWNSGESDWRIIFRPLLPDEATCADIGAL